MDILLLCIVTGSVSHMLIDENNSDIFPFCEFTEGGLNGRRWSLCGQRLSLRKKLARGYLKPYDALLSTIRKFFLPFSLIWPVPASSRPVIVSCHTFLD
jgi:hypothetical protein